MHKYKSNTNIGPGGLNCPCCRMGLTKKNARTLINRLDRRNTKQELKNHESINKEGQS